MRDVTRALYGDRAYLTALFIMICVAAALVLLGGPFAGSGIGVSPFLVNAIGQLATFAMLAVSLDLIWGYLGILSLGQGLFFSIGGYAVAMHLLKHSFEVTGKVPDFMQFMGWSEFPAYWAGFGNFSYALFIAVAVAAVVALIFGAVSFRSRVSGVYFSIITQALVYVAMLLMFRNDTGFGGNNGLTGFAVVFGWPIGSAEMITAMAATSVVVLIIVTLACRVFVASRTGRLMLAARDDEVRLRSLGYSTFRLKLAVWCGAASIAALAGFLYVPQVGIINPRLLAPDLSLEIAVWVAIGGRGHLVGAIIGAVLVNAVKFWLSAAAPDLWPFILSGLVVLVVLVFPNGLMDLARLRLVRPMGVRRLATLEGTGIKEPR
jgi:urea transport system permease protein